MKKVFIIILLIGFALLFITAAQSDSELIFGLRLFSQGFISMLITLVGFFGAYIIEGREQKKSAPGTHNARNASVNMKCQQLQNKYITIGKDCQYETTSTTTQKLPRH